MLAAAPASALRSLHVTALSMRADRMRVAVGETFHLAVHVRVAERVSALDELVIPDVGSMQILGDERHVGGGGAGGTDVVETLTLAATAAGRYAFAPAYLDAIDARSGKPTRFSAERRVTVDVVAPAGPASAPWSRLVGTVGVLALAAVVALAAMGRRRTRREAAPVPPPPAAPAATVAPSPQDAVAVALRAYRVSPGGAALEALRAALFTAAGAPAGATLRDARSATADGALREALAAADRAAFGPPPLRDGASSALIAATERWLR